MPLRVNEPTKAGEIAGCQAEGEQEASWYSRQRAKRLPTASTRRHNGESARGAFNILQSRKLRPCTAH